MSSLPKVKQVPGSARLETPRGKSPPDWRRNKFRRVRPHFFLLRLLLMTALLGCFGAGVVSTSQTMKQACAALITIPPLVCGVDALIRRRPILKAVVHFMVFGGVGLLVLSVAILSPTLVCQFAIGALLAHGTELAHQTLHKTGTGRASYDTPIGLVLCGVTFVSFYSFLWNHLRHHKYNGTEQDRESFAYAYDLFDSPSRARRLLGLVWHVTMAGQYITAVKRMALAAIGKLRGRLLAGQPDMPFRVAVRVEREYQVQALVILILVISSLVFQSTLVLELWLIPVLIGWGPVHSAIELAEHWHCDVPNPDVFRNTRSIKAGHFARWFTHFNNCHIGHHHDMSVPADQLPAYEAELAESNHLKYVEECYPAFYCGFLWHMWTGSSTLEENIRGAVA